MWPKCGTKWIEPALLRLMKNGLTAGIAATGRPPNSTVWWLTIALQGQYKPSYTARLPLTGAMSRLRSSSLIPGTRPPIRLGGLSFVGFPGDPEGGNRQVSGLFDR